jgi:hypothetical protein
MGHVHDPHEPENERQAAGKQKEHCRLTEAVQRLLRYKYWVKHCGLRAFRNVGDVSC